MCLMDSEPKVLFTEMPMLWLIPMNQDDIEEKHCYNCPTYITS